MKGKVCFHLVCFEGRVCLIRNGPWTCEERDSPEPNPSPQCHSIMPLCHYVIDMLNRRCRLALLLVHILCSRCSRIHFQSVLMWLMSSSINTLLLPWAKEANFGNRFWKESWIETNPWTPKPMKNEGWTIWVITTQNEGCGFLWNWYKNGSTL